MALGEVWSSRRKSVVKNRARELETVGRDLAKLAMSKLRFRESPTTKRSRSSRSRKCRKVGDDFAATRKRFFRARMTAR